MAGLSSTAIVGFLTSGRLIKKRVNTEEGVEIVEDFKSGFSGSGWKIWKRLGKWTFETDNIVVRGVMTVFELLIQKIRGVKGALAITQASGKVKNVRVVEDFVYLEIEDEMYFVANDFVRCQDFSGTNQHFYHVEVAEIIGKEIVIPITEFALDDLYELIDPPVIGDEIVQFGNSRDKTRQSVIYLHADEGGQPAIDLMFDVDSKDWTGKVKVSVGGEIPNSNGQRGFYSVNGLIKSVNAEGQTIYEFSPNGAVNIGNGSIVYDPDTKRLIFGKDVVLTWDNLSDDAKEKLKGEPAYILDLTNENASVTCDNQGNVVGDIPSSQANVYAGSSLDSGWSFSAEFSGCTGQIEDSGLISVTGLIDDDSFVCVGATKSGKSTLTATYNLSKTKAGTNGAPAEVYWIEPSVTVIKKTKNGVLIPSVVSCVKMKQIGAESAFITTEKELKYQLSTGSEIAYTQEVAIGNSLWIDFILYNGPVVLDRERVPVVDDGADGKDGDSVRAKYSVDGIDWHDGFKEGDIYMQLYTNGVASNVINRIVAEDGKPGVDGEYTDFQFAKSKSYTVVPDSGWEDTPPAVSSFEYLWMRSGVVTPPATIPQTWTAVRIGGIHGNSVEIQYSADGREWHNSFSNGDLYMRQRVGTGEWTAPVRIVGEVGNDGEYTDFQFAVNDSLTTAPTSGWKDAPPLVLSGQYLWMRSGVVVPPATFPQSWTAVRIGGVNGTDGIDGTDVEYIYKQTETDTQLDTPKEGSAISEGWTDSPQGVSPELIYEWVSVRYKRVGEWAEYSIPVIWSKWGENGRDGDGYEYIYKLTTDDLQPALPIFPNQEDDFVPEGWTDNPKGVTMFLPFEWVSTRKKRDGIWSTFSSPAIWGKYGQDGLSIVWKGDLATPPENPVKNWSYRDTDDGRVYIYNGTTWALMVMDGNDGADGLSVFITYHDSKEMPSKPVGNGTTGGWHTNPSADVYWMSQKVAASSTEGEWGDPIKIRGTDANLLPWVADWNGRAVQIRGESIVSPKIFSGTNTGTPENPILTGVAMGHECIEIDGVKRTGLFGVANNVAMFELDPVNGKYVFRGTIYADKGEFAGTVKGVSGSFKSLNCENKDGKVIGGIELGDDGKMWFSGDMYHQGQDNVNKRGWIFYTAKLFCRDEFGHERMTTLVIDSNNATDFYVYLYGWPVDKPANHIWSGFAGKPVDCLVLRGQGYYTIRICDSVSYKNLRVINETNYPKRVVFNHSLSATDEIGPYQFHNYVTGDSAFDFQSLTSITNLYKQYTP